jgi:hypothetical protein
MRQHFVPRSYLSNFTDPSVAGGNRAGIWQVDLAKCHYNQLTVDAVAARTDYYTVQIDDQPDNFIEDMFGEIEGNASTVIRTISEGLSLPDEAESGVLADFMAIQRLRVPAFREAVDNFYVDVATKLNAIATENRERYARILRDAMPERTFSAEEIESAWNFARDPANYSIKMNADASLKPLVASMITVARSIADMHWSYLVAPEGSQGFMTSDNPVSWGVPGGGFYDSGLMSKNAELVWPMTRRIAILGSWSDREDELLHVDEATVGRINNRILSRTQRYVFAPTEPLAKWAITQVESVGMRDQTGAAILGVNTQ